MDNTIYYVLGGLAILYLLINFGNRRKARRRRSRSFMDGYQSRSKRDRKEK